VFSGPTLIIGCSLPIAADEVIYIVPILVDEARDFFSARARLRAGVCYRAAEAYVITNEILA
jgi:hypothetical protein